MAKKRIAREVDALLESGVPAWARGLDLSESRALAASLRASQEAREERERQAREKREHELAGREPARATITRRVVRGGGPLVITTAKYTGDANRAWKAIVAAKLHVWDTAPGMIEVVTGHDFAGVKRRTIDALEEAGFLVEDHT